MIGSIDWQIVLFISVTAFVATLLSSMSGGGSSMITTPIYLMLGFPLPVAIATNDVSGAAWSMAAARNYLRGHKIDFKLVTGLLTFGFAGAFAGTQVIMRSKPENIERVIGVIIILLVIFTYTQRKFGLEEKPPRANRLIASLLGIPLGFYEAFFGAGNGIFTSSALSATRGFRILEALGYYYVVASLWCTFAATIYISNGHWDLKLMIPSLVGSFIGGSIGSRIGRKQGAVFVKTISIIVGTVLGLKLIILHW